MRSPTLHAPAIIETVDPACEISYNTPFVNFGTISAANAEAFAIRHTISSNFLALRYGVGTSEAVLTIPATNYLLLALVNLGNWYAIMNIDPI